MTSERQTLRWLLRTLLFGTLFGLLLYAAQGSSPAVIGR